MLPKPYLLLVVHERQGMSRSGVKVIKLFFSHRRRLGRKKAGEFDPFQVSLLLDS
jgi:hypothetical protein